jgi:glutaredoxin
VLVTLLERRGCHLCDAAREVLRRLLAGRAIEMEIVDVESRADLEAAWGLEVPVVLVDGDPVCRGRVDANALARRLAPGAGGPPRGGRPREEGG